MIRFLGNIEVRADAKGCRFNPGGTFDLGNGIMDNPGDSKYGMSEEQMTEEMCIRDRGWWLHTR